MLVLGIVSTSYILKVVLCEFIYSCKFMSVGCACMTIYFMISMESGMLPLPIDRCQYYEVVNTEVELMFSRAFLELGEL